MAIVYPTTDPGTLPAPPESPIQRTLDFAGQHVVLAGVLTLGIALLIGFLVHKLRGGSSSISSSTTDQQPQTLYVPTQNTYENFYSATDSNNLAPVNSPVTTTTMSSVTNNPPPPKAPALEPEPSLAPALEPKPPPTPEPMPAPKPTPAPAAKYVTATAWPSPYGSLSGIAQAKGLTLMQIEGLNPQITNPNLIYPGEQIRIGSGGDPFFDGHWVLPSSIFAFNHHVHENMAGA
jgi:hypothetical protein